MNMIPGLRAHTRGRWFQAWVLLTGSVVPFFGAEGNLLEERLSELKRLIAKARDLNMPDKVPRKGLRVRV